MSSNKRHVYLTYCAWHHALSWHQVVIKALQATVQRVGDPALVVIQGGVHSLLAAPQRAPWAPLNEEAGDFRIMIGFTQSLFFHSQVNMKMIPSLAVYCMVFSLIMFIKQTLYTVLSCSGNSNS